MKKLILIFLLLPSMSWGATVTLGDTTPYAAAHCTGNTGCETYGDLSYCDADAQQYGNCSWVDEVTGVPSVLTLGGDAVITIGD
jgi:hypothetical protein